MSTKYRDHGGPAFPVPGLSMNQATGEQIHHQTMEGGMTLRDYFAAQAMQGMLSHPTSDEYTWGGVAESAYKMADAMLAARKDRE